VIHSIFYQPGKPLQTDLTLASLRNVFRSRMGVLWVDFDGEPPETCQPSLESFGFHPLAIDDALQETHSPKIDDWGNYIYVVMNYMHMNGAGKDKWGTEID
jgi:magnesium transporter